jgi:hypothetical protein
MREVTVFHATSRFGTDQVQLEPQLRNQEHLKSTNIESTKSDIFVPLVPFVVGLSPWLWIAAALLRS